MSMNISVIPSVNVNDTSSTNTSTENNTLQQLLDIINSPIKHTPVNNPTNLTVNAVGISSHPIRSLDPRSCIDFGSKARVLKGVIQQKVNEAFDMLPDGLSIEFKRHCVLSGSSISSMYHNEEVKDYDLWLKDYSVLEYIEYLLNNYYIDYVAEYSEKYSGIVKNGKVITSNAYTLKNKMQFIKLVEYETARKHFDFVHCMPYYDFATDKFFISEHQMELIANKKLEVNPGGNAPVQWRIEKFKMRGWSF